MINLRHIIYFLVCLYGSLQMAYSQNYSEFESLYPDCVDNQDSPIYGGTYGKWPEGLNLPEFPGGGDIQLTRYIHDNMDYPHVVESTDSAGNEVLAKGVVAIQVVIDRCGRATRQEIIQSVNSEYDEEALRITQGLPIFKPGDLYGERVKVAIIIPVRFSRSSMPPPPESEYGNFWEDSGSDNYNDWSDSDDSGSSGGKYDNVQWDDSW